MRAAIVALRTDFDSHNHDGSSSRSFETLQANTMAAQAFLIRKTSYADTNTGVWMGIVNNVMKMKLGSASSYLQWDGSALSVVGSITATSGTIGSWTIGTNTITGSGASSTIQTASSGARAALTGGNDLELYDDTTGGGGTITGNVAEINMIRTDDSTKYFTLRKRAGKDNDSDNVFELFPTTPASGRYNAMFIGADGFGVSGSNNNTGAIQFTINKTTANSAASLNGSFNIVVADNNTPNATPHFFIQDARQVLGSSASGWIGILAGSGTDGLSALGYVSGGNVYYGIFQASTTEVGLGLTMVPDTDNTYDIGTSSFRIRSMYLQTNIVYRGITQPVMYCGYVSSTTITASNNSFTASNPSTGNYTITHNLGTTLYSVQLTALRASGAGAYTAKVAAINSNSFTVIVFDDTGAAQNGDFSFLLVKP